MSYDDPYFVNQQPQSQWSGYEFLTRIMGFSFVASLVPALGGGAGGIGSIFGGGNTATDATAQGGNNPYSYLWNSASLFVLGLIIETGRRLCQWLIERVRFQYTITAQFNQGDPTYEWLILFLTDAQIWKSSREFRVSATSSIRKWGVKPDTSSSSADASPNPTTGSTLSSLFSVATVKAFWWSLPFVGDTSERANLHLEEKAHLLTGSSKDKAPHAEYVPTYDAPQLFRWKGYWAEIRRSNGRIYNPMMGPEPTSTIYLTIYTHDMNVLSSFVEEAREGYIKTNLPHVIVHTADQPNFGPMFTWTNAKSKARRPLSSIILQEGVINSLVADVREFLETEDWYVKAGIPHRRGYLLYGPPGTGKTSTIYAIAGDLGLEIFSISLASSFVDDSLLQRAVAAVPKNSIFLIEDIDCAFPSPRDSNDPDDNSNNYPNMYGAGHMPMGGMVVPGNGMMGAGMKQRSLVTLSGLLNVLDGVGSEEGKIFFATTNHVDHLDPALMRPGRIDRKIEYKLATQAQAEALFIRFYPEEVIQQEAEQKRTGSDPEKSQPIDSAVLLHELATSFAASIPPHEFSTAELQGYLLTWKKSPSVATEGADEWVKMEQADREARKERDEVKRKERAKAASRREERETERLRGRLGLGPLTPGGSNVAGFIGGPGASTTSLAVVSPPVGDAPNGMGMVTPPTTTASLIAPSFPGVGTSSLSDATPLSTAPTADLDSSIEKGGLVNGL
ncbi:hypothetical protein CPB83DRAFT_853845 [Crepidotus variabilis]|uniref:P-loop containing nucleoside triphosphate hydrolase protein n=1 Tax=Crepidotus variabilis TaxID=179855 RepID=A0A9P6EH79_9AGAR|nr:hypothetical protein CPB83DRAFT_853845 [Crepidotus variabilis]